MNGVTYSVSVVARNSVGDSGMFIVMLFVPCECSRPANVVLHMHTHLTSTHNETPSRSISPAVPPNITMQPVAVTPNETTTQCCAGIRVFLEDPTDPTIVFTAQVSTDGTPFTDRFVTREGDVVYVEGLQAGTPYNIRLTAWNQFGSTIKDELARPLIGETVFALVVRSVKTTQEGHLHKCLFLAHEIFGFFLVCLIVVSVGRTCMECICM